MPDVICYTDYKSPYAYLALDELFALEDETGVRFDWRPYTLDIPDYLGSATLDADGKVVEQNRTAHQWRRVKYSYMDVRRYANRKGLTIRGTTRIWDSSLANIGLLWARRQGAPDAVRAYHLAIFAPFWRRDLDIEDPAVVAGVLAGAGIDTAGFDAFLDGPGRAEHDAIRADAEARGVFGVPSLLVGDELFWGREHLPLVRERLGKP